MAVDFEKLTGGKRFSVYGNLPYYITSPILHRLFEHADRIAAIHIVIQFEVAVRIVAQPGRRDYGYLSVVSQWFSRPEIAFSDSSRSVSAAAQSCVRARKFPHAWSARQEFRRG